MATVTVYDIIKGISQAAANAYDGAHMENYASDGKARKAGLKREEGDPIVDSRIMDGFSVAFHGDRLLLNYHSELSIKEVHNSDLESDIEQILADVVKFLKKEYKSVTGNSLTLTPEGKTSILLQNMSNIRTWAQCRKVFKIGNLSGVDEVRAGSDKTPDERLEDNIKKFLQLGKG